MPPPTRTRLQGRPADVRRGQGVRPDLLADVPEGRDREVPRGHEADGAALPRPARPEPAPRRAGEVRRVRAVRVGLPRGRHLRRGRRQHRGGALLARRAVRRDLPDQLPAVHLLRAVHRGVPDPVADDVERVRARRRQPAGPDLHQGAADGPAAAGHGGAAAPDAARRDRAGVLRRRPVPDGDTGRRRCAGRPHRPSPGGPHPTVPSADTARAGVPVNTDPDPDRFAMGSNREGDR